MKNGPIFIKNANDFILAIIMLGISGYILLAKNICSFIPNTGLGGFFARPDVYIKMLSIFLIILSVVLLAKSVSISKKNVPIKKFSFYLNKEIVSTTVALCAYTLLMPVVGFIITTFLLTFFLVLIFSLKFKNIKFSWRSNKKVLIRLFVISFVYAFVADIVMYLVFTYLFGISLP